MRIAIALTSFKGTLSALSACQVVKETLAEALPGARVDLLPITDGGDGFLDSISFRYPTTKIPLFVTGPLGNTIESEYLLLKEGKKKMAFIESARVCGLTLVPLDKRNPLLTTTYGLGEMIRHALKRADILYVGLGGSATQDGGAGLAQALGAKLLDANRHQIGFGAGWIQVLERIDMTYLEPRLKKTQIFALTDVNNPLLGKSGTARVYAPQKGASPQQVKIIERNLSRYARIVKRDTSRDVRNIPGSGAAGGLGAGMAAFCKAKILPGFATILDLIKAKDIIAKADIVLVGEGRLDSQSLYGKAAKGIADVAKSHKKKILGIFGDIAQEPRDLPKRLGLSAWITLIELAGSRKKAMANAQEVLQKAAVKLFSPEFR